MIGGTATAAAIRYSLGRALLGASETRSGAPRRASDRALAARMLKAALDSGHLWRARERRAAELLAHLGEE
jgi:NaMN:DMB phosphoribosyltransferase